MYLYMPKQVTPMESTIYIFEIGNQYSVYEHIKVHNSKIFKSDWNAYLLAYMPTSALTQHILHANTACLCSIYINVAMVLNFFHYSLTKVDPRPKHWTELKSFLNLQLIWSYHWKKLL